MKDTGVKTFYETNMKKQILIFLMIMLIIPLCFAYDYVGQNDYRLGSGILNEANINYSLSTRSLGHPTFSPLVNDLDNDGTDEIVVLDIPTIRLYQDSTLDVVDAYTLSLSTNDRNISNMVLFDIDNDNYTEIILASSVERLIYIIEYNGTNIYLQKNHSWSGVSDILNTHGLRGESMIHCGATEECLMSYTRTKSSFGGSTSAKLRSIPFNSTNLGVESARYESSATPPQVYCFPTIKGMDYKDYDNDGEYEYIHSVLLANTAGNEFAQILYIDVNDTLGATIEGNSSSQMGSIIDSGSLHCETNNISRHITSSLTYDFDGASSNGLESVVGFMIDSDEFKMHSFSGSREFLDDYPEILQADGVIVSNIMRVNSFTDTGAVDFCVMGYATDDNKLDLLCASEQTGQAVETDEFFYTPEYNIEYSWGSYNILTHTGAHSSNTEDGNNLDEIISTYGVFELDYTLVNELDLIFENPKPNAVVITADAQSNGLEDMILLTSTNLWYINDGYSTSGALIDEYTINPCINAVWEYDVNGSNTAEITITPTDADGDDVSARAILFNNETFAQDSGWSANVSSGTTLAFNFIVNESVTASEIQLFAVDTSNPDDIDMITLSVTTGSSGVLKGDCLTSVSDLVETPTGTNDTTELSEEDLENLGDELSDLTGVSRRYQPLLAIIFIFLAIMGTAFGLAEYGIKDGMVLLYLPLFVGLAVWVLAVSIGWLPAWTILVSILMCSAIIGFKVYNNRNSGGL